MVAQSALGRAGCAAREQEQRRIIRTISDPRVRFQEDPLRILRAIRFSCRLGLEIDPPAFEANRRNTPIDDLNLNRLFPGDRGGWFSEQLAAAITSEFLTKVDVLIDIHSGGDRPTVDYIYIRNAEELSRAFGSKVLYRADSTG